MVLALEGIRVVDVAQVAAVPMVARHLADFGAEVIHIENPATGDSWRDYQAGQGKGSAGAPSGINYNWEAYNRNKKSVAVDLSREAGRQVIYKMVAKADVFLTNLRPFELEKFQLEYSTLSRMNPRLVYGSLTGFGRKGPEKDAPAYDTIAYWTRAGLGHLLTVPGEPPPVIGGGFGDNVAALALFSGIMTALFARERTGVGQEVDVSLFGTGIYQLSFFIAGALATGLDLADWGVYSREESPNPLILPYQAKDGRWLLLYLLQQERYWSKFCRTIEREDLQNDPRFVSLEARTENRAALCHIIEEVMLTRTLDEWKTRFTEAGIPFAPYQNFQEVVHDPQARANGLFVPMTHPAGRSMEVMASPIQLSETPATLRMPAPEFGQHTEEVLQEYGYTPEDIVRLKKQRVIA